MARDTSRRGAEAEAIFRAAALRQGWEIVEPSYDARGYDCVINRKIKKWDKVQIKRAYEIYVRTRKHQAICLHRSSKKPYTKNDFDFIGAVWGNRVFLIPWRVVKGMTQILLSSPKYAKYELKGE